MNKGIKILLAVLIGFTALNTASAQVTRTDFFMETSYLRNQLNPAMRPDQGYLVLPVLPNVGVSLQTNSINLHTLTFPHESGQRVTFMHPSVDANRFLSGLSNNNYISGEVNLKLFGLGFFRGDNFWNISLGIRTHIDANVPKPFFGLLKNGFDQHEQTSYSLANLSFVGQSFAELGLSHSRPFLDNSLMVGARVKLIGGLADAHFNAKRLSIVAGPEYWEAQSRVLLNVTAPGVRATYNEDDSLDSIDFSFDNFAMPGFGLGFDLGAVYHLGAILPAVEGLRVSASLNDIGFISWSGNHSVRLVSPETTIRIDSRDAENYDQGSSLSDLFDNIFDEIQEAVTLKASDVQGSRTMALRANLVLGVEYEIIKHRLSAGLLFTNRFGNYFNKSEFTVSANGRPTPWLSTSISYSVVHSHFNTFGFALHITPSAGLNLFLASDYVIPHVNSYFIPTTTKGLNFQAGISIPLGSRRSNRSESL